MSSLDEKANKQILEDSALPELSRATYSIAVRNLTHLALSGHHEGAAAVAAQVLLSLFDGNKWHINLTHLHYLDMIHFKSAILAIRGRIEFNEEPHMMIDDGDELFSQMIERWQAYRIDNRYQEYK